MRHIKILLLFFIGIVSLTGCLKKNESNIDPYDFTSPVYTLEWIQPGGTTVNSGLQFFSSGALTYPASDIADTANFTVRLTGSPVSNDVNITIAPDSKALLDNFATDSIPYLAMPDSVYKFINTTATIKKGTNTASFSVVFYPSKIDPSKNFMLAPSVTAPADHQVSSNQGHIYFHTIGNPIAGAYTGEYIRIPSADSTATPDTHVTGKSSVFAPSSPTVVTVPTGYYTAPNYIISFTNNGGVLSNFSVVIDPTGLAGFTAGGVSIIIPPSIQVSPDYKTIKINYLAFNGSNYRYVFDNFVKK